MLARWTLWSMDDARILHQSIFRRRLAAPRRVHCGSAVREEGRRASRASSAEDSPHRQKNQRPRHGAFCFSRRAWLRMRTLFDSSSGAAAIEDATARINPTLSANCRRKPLLKRAFIFSTCFCQHLGRYSCGHCRCSQGTQAILLR